MESYSTHLSSLGGVQNMWAGKVQSLAMDVAILLARCTLVRCALRTKLAGCSKNSIPGFNATLQQRLVLASVQAFTRCLAAPGGLQHTGKHLQPAAPH